MTSVEDVKHAAEELAHETQETVDAGIHSLARGLGGVLKTASQVASETYEGIVYVLDEAQGYVTYASNVAKAAGDTAVNGVKGVIQYTASNPYTAYPALATTGALLLPGTRRMLWRMTAGRFTNPAAVVERSQGRVDTLKSEVVEYAAQLEKLEERVALGEEEFNRGLSMLKSARHDLQKLGRSVASSQSTAARVVRDLRALKKVDNSLPLRGEAADLQSNLKDQLARINKDVNRIAAKDI